MARNATRACAFLLRKVTGPPRSMENEPSRVNRGIPTLSALNGAILAASTAFLTVFSRLP